MATNEEIKQYYADLLILQYRGKPKAYAQIEAMVDPVIMNQLPTAVQNAFNLDSAIGTQLDVAGKYAGVTRYVNDFSGPVTLGDDDFRQFIKIAIARNAASSSLDAIQNLLQLFFSGVIYIFDYRNMHISYWFNSLEISNELAQVFVTSGLLPRPMGVQLGEIVYLPASDSNPDTPQFNNAFGFALNDVPAYNTHGFNLNTAYDHGCHWVDNGDTL